MELKVSEYYCDKCNKEVDSNIDLRDISIRGPIDAIWGSSKRMASMTRHIIQMQLCDECCMELRVFLSKDEKPVAYNEKR